MCGTRTELMSNTAHLGSATPPIERRTLRCLDMGSSDSSYFGPLANPEFRPYPRSHTLVPLVETRLLPAQHK